MDRSRRDFIVRKLFHCSAPLYLVYYFIPDYVYGVSKHLAMFLFMCMIIAFEALRISQRKVFLGLRENEKRRLSSYAWAGIAIVILLIYFPMYFVVPVVFGMAWVDPIISECQKRRKYYPSLPLAVHLAIMFVGLYFLSPFGIPTIIFFAMIGSFSAIIAEYPNFRHVDDDFLMLFVPALCLVLAETAIVG